MRLIKYNTYNEQGFVKETNLTTSSFSEVNAKLLSNYYFINTVHKLFKNTRINEVLVSDSIPQQQRVFQNIEQENLSSDRNLMIDISKIAYQNEDISKKIEIIGDVPEALDKSFLGLELLVLQKIKQEYGDKASLSPYAERLSKMVSSLYMKDITQITIDDKFIKSVLLEQSNRFDNIKDADNDIKRENHKVNQITQSLLKTDENIKRFKDLISKNQNKIKDANDELEKVELEKNRKLKEKLTSFDKAKIKFFEVFGVAGVEDAILVEKEKKFPNLLSVFKEVQAYQKGMLEHFESENNKYNSQIGELKLSMEKDREKKEVLINYIKDRQSERSLIDENSFVKDLDKDISGLQKRTVSEASKDNLMFIHVVPHFQPLENSPLKEEVSAMERLLAIRAFNPSLSTSTFKLDGTNFENTTFGKGVIGVILSKGIVGTIKSSDAGTIVDENGMRDQGSNYDLYQEELERAKQRSNQGSGYNEATVHQSVPYANIILLDRFFAEKKETYHIDGNLNVSNQVMKQLYEKVTQSGEMGQSYGIKPLPTVIMLNGKILEIVSSKPEYFNNFKSEAKLNNQEMESLIRDSFNIKEIKSINEMTNKEDYISNDSRENLAKTLYSKYKDNMITVLEEKLKINHGIGLSYK